MKDSYKASIGDEVIIEIPLGNKSFNIAQFIEEPAFGTSIMGIKIACINEQDLNALYEQYDDEKLFGYKFINILQRMNIRTKYL